MKGRIKLYSSYVDENTGHSSRLVDNETKIRWTNDLANSKGNFDKTRAAKNSKDAFKRKLKSNLSTENIPSVDDPEIGNFLKN